MARKVWASMARLGRLEHLPRCSSQVGDRVGQLWSRPLEVPSACRSDQGGLKVNVVLACHPGDVREQYCRCESTSISGEAETDSQQGTERAVVQSNVGPTKHKAAFWAVIVEDPTFVPRGDRSRRLREEIDPHAVTDEHEFVSTEISHD